MARNAAATYRIDAGQEFLLKAAALVLDAIEFLLTLTVIGAVASEVIGITGTILFFIWFHFLGVKYFDGRGGNKLMTMMVNSVIEAIPFVNGFYPGFSIAAWRIVAITKKEDEERAEKKGRLAAMEEAEALRQQQRTAQAIQAQRRAEANTQERAGEDA
jgi:hypothetical protein